MKIKLKHEEGWFYVLNKNETKKTTDILEESDEFEKGILSLRKRYKVPKKWFQRKRKHFITYLDNWSTKKLDKFFHDSQKLNEQLNLPYNWWSSIAYFAAFDVFFCPEVIPVEIRDSTEVKDGTSLHFIKLSSHYLAIDDSVAKQVYLVLNEKLTKPQLHKWIDIEWDKIQERLENLPTPPRHKWIRVNIAKKVVELRDNAMGGKRPTFKEIAEKLSKEYENNEDVYDLLTEDYVKNLYYRWKNRAQR